MAMDANEIERLIRAHIPDADVTTRRRWEETRSDGSGDASCKSAVVCTMPQEFFQTHQVSQ